MSDIKHKINLDNIYDEYGNSDYDEFLNKYSDEIKSGAISQECLDKMTGIVLDIKEDVENDIKYFIKRIYIAIISIKYLSNEKVGLDIGQAHILISSINYLNNNWVFKFLYNDKQECISRLSKEVFDELKSKSCVYSDDMEKCGFIEEFNISHLTSLKYYLDIFVEIGKKYHDDEFVKIFSDENLWRFT